MDFHNCNWPPTVVKPLLAAAAAEDRLEAEMEGQGMRRVGSKTWLPTMADDGAASLASGSPRQSAAGREKIKSNLWMSAAVDDYFIRKNDDMLERLLPKIRADIAAVREL